MKSSLIYPGAIQRRYKGVTGTPQPTITKLVLHSTETPGGYCPGYQGGKAAPTLTLDPWNGTIWQHFDANESAKALVDSSSTAVRENRDNVAQVEILGYSDQNLARRYGFDLRNIGQAGIQRIADVIAWYHEVWGVPLRIPESWPMYPASAGKNAARMSGPVYDKFEGVLGHLHVPGNSHGDPAIPIDRIMAAVRGDDPQPLEEDMQFTDEAGTGKDGVFTVGQGLVRGQTAYEQVGEIRPKFAKAEKEISELRSQVSTLMARTASFDHAGGLLDIQRALRRGATAYDQVGEIRPRFAKAETQLAELRASLADIAAGQGKDVQQALAEAGAAMQRAADAMIEASTDDDEGVL